MPRYSIIVFLTIIHLNADMTLLRKRRYYFEAIIDFLRVDYRNSDSDGDGARAPRIER
jgi:hypothetical protein